jgi:hypothetical protein
MRAGNTGLVVASREREHDLVHGRGWPGRLSRWGSPAGGLSLSRLGANELAKGQFGRALTADSLLNPARALPNNFLERSDSLLILWSDSLK